jgi:hypothetical protein
MTGRLSSIPVPLCFHCYIRLIITSWFQWYHCHSCWRHRRLPFAIVNWSGVATVVWQKTWLKHLVITWQKDVEFFFVRFSTGIQYKLYRSAHLSLS